MNHYINHGGLVPPKSSRFFPPPPRRKRKKRRAFSIFNGAPTGFHSYLEPNSFGAFQAPNGSKQVNLHNIYREQGREESYDEYLDAESVESTPAQASRMLPAMQSAAVATQQAIVDLAPYVRGAVSFVGNLSISAAKVGANALLEAQTGGGVDAIDEDETGDFTDETGDFTSYYLLEEGRDSRSPSMDAYFSRLGGNIGGDSDDVDDGDDDDNNGGGGRYPQRENRGMPPETLTYGADGQQQSVSMIY